MTRPNSFVFVGLGNPGTKYQLTRHNMGFLVIQELACKLGWHLKESKGFQAFVTKGVIEETTLHLVLPMTYMNLSGTAVKAYMDFFKLSPNQLVVVTDDVALPFGQMRLKTMGSTGGHNGLKSIEAHLKTAHYMRLRMGIGHPGESTMADYVLDPFSEEELKQLNRFVNEGCDALMRLLNESPSHVMNSVNRTQKPLLG